MLSEVRPTLLAGEIKVRRAGAGDPPPRREAA